MTLRLPDSVLSPQDVTSLILEVKEYARWYQKRVIAKRTATTAAAEPPAISPEALRFIHGISTKKALSSAELDSLITALERLKSSARIVTITVAAPPSRELKSSIARWCRVNLAPDILIAFRFNRTLLGGMVVHSGSHIFDWSFRRAILENRTAFPEVLRRV